jgi:hypothetical protein
MPESDQQNRIDLDSEAKRNLIGAFELLLKVDRRANPQFYKKPNQNYENHGNTNQADKT